MTDKPIMIDGVDVADCEHINACDKKIKCVILQDDVCETNPYCEGFNCYFKQLARKTQECEELKNEVELLKQYKGSKQASYERMQIEWNKAVSQNKDLLKQVEDWQEKYNQLKADNEKLKNIIQKSANSFCNDYVEAIENYDKLKEELAHIQHNCTREGCKYYDNDDYKVFYRCKAEQKLERIREDITKIKDCVTTEMVEIATRKDYNGFLALKGISVKTTQILQIIDEVE